MTRTYSPKAGDITRDWYLVDATGQTLGRLTAAVARVLQGKHKPSYVPHLDSGDFVIVINAEKTVLTGNKEDEKVYYRQSGRPGGLKMETARVVRARKPRKLVEEAVKGMLPKTTMGRQQYRKLKVYAGAEHPHQAQKPQALPASALRA